MKAITHNLLVCLVTLAIFSCNKSMDNGSAQPTEQLVAGRDYLPGEVLIQFKPTPDEASRQALIRSWGGSIREYVFTQAMQDAGDPGFYVVRFRDDDIRKTLTALKANPDIFSAEPNFIVDTNEEYQPKSGTGFLAYPQTEEYTSPNDPYFPGQWNLRGPGSATPEPFGSNAEAIWQSGNTGSSGIVVALVGTGLMYEHEDLARNMWVNENDPVDGSDNDGNGYVDDYHGWNFAAKNNEVFDARLSSETNGDRMASIIGGNSNNGIGITGMCWDVKMFPVKIYKGGPAIATSVYVQSFDYITALRNRGVNIIAANNHYETKKSTQLQAAVQRMEQADILLISAAGRMSYYNSEGGTDLDKNPSYPSCFTNANIISVTSLNQDGSSTRGFNWGSRSVDLAAPGENIIAAINPAYDYYGIDGDGYGDHPSGYPTFAVAHVTAAAVLYKSRNPGANHAAIKAAILGTALPAASQSGLTVTGGRLFLDPAVFGF